MPIGAPGVTNPGQARAHLAATRELLARHDVGRVSTQQIADGADVAVGTLNLYPSTTLSCLLMPRTSSLINRLGRGLTGASKGRHSSRHRRG
jgi:hypothetical protein